MSVQPTLPHGAGPMVSVVLPTFNRLKYIPAAIASILGQSFRDWELIIADDGSDAGTRAYLSSIDDPRVGLMWLAHSGRPAVARNAAMRRAKGEFIAFMDSDDVWLPTKLEVQVATLRRRTHCAWSQTSFTLADATGRAIRHMPAADGWIIGKLASAQTVIALPSVMAYRVLLEDAGGFDEDLVTCEDYDLWLRLAVRSEVAAVSEPLTVVRRHHQHYSDPITAYKDSIRVIDKLLRSNTAPEFAPVVRGLRAKWCGRLARTYVDAGNRTAAARMLRSSAASSWRYWHWWRDGLAAVLHCLVPIAARRFARKVYGGPA